ncbi:MAG: YqgE/AlgH family protein [Deltaproteobacteria bacterium]
MSGNLTFREWGGIRKGCACIALATAIVLISALVGLPSIGLARLNYLPWRNPVFLRIDQQPRFGLKPAKGKFLVASRQLLDPNFSQTVVLLIDYQEHGAMGLIINRPSELKLSEALPEMEELQQRPDTIYLGGPVARNQLLLLIRTTSPPEGSQQVFADIYLTSSQTVIERMIKDSKVEERFRFYAGYAGWGAGQLDNEIAMGGWHVMGADVETVFDRSASEIWPDLIYRSSARWVRLLE